MAGPTPVSALIHAATMVTAGVYLVVRSGTVFEATPDAQLAVVIVGAITLTFGAVVGCAKDDIKKALAASTMSQIGYMLLAAGLGPIGYAFAISHLLNHGFFKAGLFLGAGSVMHGMNDRVDMRWYGNLSTVMKITWVTFGIGWLAILGVPPFSGFWSKDKIIESAFVGEGWRPWVFGLTTLIGAGITAFYMSRLFFMTFHGDQRWPKDAHPHESPRVMTVPMVVLAVGSALLGLALTIGGAFNSWLNPAVGGEAEEGHPVLPGSPSSLPSSCCSSSREPRSHGCGTPATRCRRRRPRATWPPRPPATTSTRTRSTRGCSCAPAYTSPERWTSWTARGVDGAAGGLAALIGGTSARVRRVQNGLARSYALTMLVGVVVILGAVWVIQ